MTQKLEWDELWAAMKAAPEAWIETTDKMYEHMLGVVPPRAQLGEWFLVGEPYTHNDEGKAVYVGFKTVNERYYAKHLTVAQFRAEYAA